MLVREVMTTSPVTVRPGTTVQAALQLVAEAHVTSLPVVDRSGRVLGMLSRSDVVRALAGSDADLRRDIDCALTCIGLRDWLVEVHDGAADLTGPSDPDAVDLARLAAATVPGVTSVRILVG